MLNSMTGFGRVTKEYEGKNISVEIKSVNHRFFECSIRTPRGMSYLEEPIKALLNSKVSRGKIEVYITVETIGEGSIEISYNADYLSSFLKTLGEISKKFKLKNDVKLSDVAHNKDIFTVKKAEENEEELLAQVLETLEEATSQYNEARAKEGERLRADMVSRLDGIESNVGIIEERSPETVKEYREKLLLRMQEVLGDSKIDEQRILTEAAIYADKITVAEETTRLRTHIANFRDLLSGASPIGKKLDFYMQEMNREINTIGSKCNDISIAKTVVDVKSQLENIREQIQNIE